MEECSLFMGIVVIRLVYMAVYQMMGLTGLLETPSLFEKAGAQILPLNNTGTLVIRR
jgi:hypothetical protein